MSFPFLQPYAGLSNSLQTAQAVGGAVGGWVELGRTTLGSAGDTISVSSLPNKRYFWCQLYTKATAGTIQQRMRFNNDSGSNYAERYSQDGGTDGTITSDGELLLSAAPSTPAFTNMFITNNQSNEKLVIGHNVNEGGAGASNDPERYELAHKWANTSNEITQIDIINTGSGNFDTGSECIVLGWDPADTHTSNFWEELASVELGGAGDNLSSGTISARKYLWVQAWFKNGGGTNRILPGMRFNNDSGSNYAYRRSIDGGADGTSTSITNLHALGTSVSGANQFYNFFIINNSANEKLAIFHAVDMQTGTGAGNAPRRSESVGKWANTSAQITEVEFDNLDTGDFGTGSIIKVWGSD
jgi:hypothetical protein